MVATQLSPDVGLDELCSAKENARAKRFDAIEGFSSEEDLGPAELKTSNGTSGSKVKAEELLPALRTGNGVMLLSKRCRQDSHTVLGCFSLLLGGHCRALPCNRLLHLGLSTSLSASAVLGSILLLLGPLNLQNLEHHLVICLPHVIGDLINELLQFSLLRRREGTALHWRCRGVISLVTKDIVPCQEDIMGVTGGIASTTNSDSLKDTTTAELLNNVLWLKVVGDELIIGLQATNVMRDRGINSGAKGLELGGKLRTDRLGRHSSSTASLLRSNIIANIMDKTKFRRLE